MEKKKWPQKRLCWVSLLLAFAVFIGSTLVAKSIDTQGNTVKVQDIYFTSYIDGSLQHGRIYIPANATPETPAPAVIWIPGNDTDIERCAMFGVEYSRRGYVVYLSDIRNQGSSEGANCNVKDDTNGADEAGAYIRSLSFVDSNYVSIGGHSLGGMDAVLSAQLHPDWYAMVYGFGVASTCTKIPQEPGIDVWAVTGRDEGNAKNWEPMAEYYGYGIALSEWEPGKVYGSFEDKTARCNYQAMGAVHATEYWNDDTWESFINFTQGSMPAPNPISGSDQVWKGRYVATTIALIAILFMLIPAGTLLLETPFFAAMCRPVPVFQGNTGKRWWIFLIPTIVLAPATYLVWSSTANGWFAPLATILNIRRVSMTLAWVMKVAGVTLLMLVAGYFLYKKERRPSMESYAFTFESPVETVKNIGKALLFTILLLGGMYAIIALTFRWTLIDPRIWNTSLRVLNWARVTRILLYFIPFALSMFVILVNLHGTMRPKEGKISVFKEILVNIGIMAPWYFIWAIWLGPFAWLKASGSTPSFSGFLYTFFWGVPVMQTIIATLSTFFFRKTGRVFVGVFMSAFIMGWVLLGVISLYGTP